MISSMFMIKAAALVGAMLGAAAGVPTIESLSDGSLLLSPDSGGSVKVDQLGGLPALTVATTADVTAQRTQLNTAISQAVSASAATMSQSLAQASTSASAALSTAMSSVVVSLNMSIANVTGQITTGQQFLSGRADSADLGLVAAASGRMAITSSVTATTARVAALETQLSTAVAAVVSMGTALNALGNTCTLSTLPGYPVTNMVYTLVLPVAGGTAVIQGGEVVVSGAPGSYLAGGAVTVVCGPTGWAGTPPTTVSQCAANCGSCTGPTDCSVCTAGYFRNVTAAYANLPLNPATMAFDPIGATTANVAFNPATMSQNTGAFLSAATVLLRATPDAGQWNRRVYYNGLSCYDPAWLQVDLGSVMRLGSVTVWKYWNDGRRYCGQRIAVSSTGAFNGEETDLQHTAALRVGYGLPETAAGIDVSAYGVTGRYIRIWSGRSNVNTGVHFVGIRATAAPLSAATSTVCSPV